MFYRYNLLGKSIVAENHAVSHCELHTRGCAIYDIRLKRIVNPNLVKPRLLKTLTLLPQIVLQFCTEHGIDTGMLYAELHTDWTTETCFMNGRNFVRFKFQGNILYCTALMQFITVSILTKETPRSLFKIARQPLTHIVHDTQCLS